MSLGIPQPRRTFRQMALKSIKKETKLVDLSNDASDSDSDLSSVPDDSEDVICTGFSAMEEEELKPNIVSLASIDLHSNSTEYGWNHPSELEYLTPSDWSDTQIIHHLLAHSFDLPPKKPHGGHPFVEVTSIDGSKTVLPSGYRIPLMFLQKYLWFTLQSILADSNSDGTREERWDRYKFPLLHISRLCKTLFRRAQEALGGFYVDLDSGKTRKIPKQEGVDRMWRCDTFDRALVRCKMRCFITEKDKGSVDEQMKEFWEKHQEEYTRDILRYAWKKWVLTGYDGLALTDREIESGTSAKNLINGLMEKSGRWYWATESIHAGGIDAWTLRMLASKSSRCVTPSLPARVDSPLILPSPLQVAKPTARKRPGCVLEKEGASKRARKTKLVGMDKVVKKGTAEASSVKFKVRDDSPIDSTTRINPISSTPPPSGKQRSLLAIHTSHTTRKEPPILILRPEELGGEQGSSKSSLTKSPKKTLSSASTKAAAPNETKPSTAANSKPRITLRLKPPVPPSTSSQLSATEVKEIKETLHRVESLVKEHKSKGMERSIGGLEKRMARIETRLGLSEGSFAASERNVTAVLERIEGQLVGLREELKRVSAGSKGSSGDLPNSQRHTSHHGGGSELEGPPALSSHYPSSSTFTGMHAVPSSHAPPPLLSYIHPLAHLLGEPTNVEEGVSTMVATRINYPSEVTGNPQPSPSTPRAQPSAPPRHLSPSDDIEDIKPVILDGEAFLPSIRDNEGMVSVSAFSGPARRQRKLMKLSMGTNGTGE
ncbi:hypothetical protein PM082_018677 [Marasmius tenuissimus]|nr:hypothetical protein PM082_018677 [Marasmius tenuissimus]